VLLSKELLIEGRAALPVPVARTGPLHLFFSISKYSRTTNFLVFGPRLLTKYKYSGLICKKTKKTYIKF
jgi:hypothetical protein